MYGMVWPGLEVNANLFEGLNNDKSSECFGGITFAEDMWRQQDSQIRSVVFILSPDHVRA